MWNILPCTDAKFNALSTLLLSIYWIWTFSIKNLDKLYPYVVGYMKSQPNLQLIIYNEFLYSTLVEVTLKETIQVFHLWLQIFNKRYFD